MKSSSFLSERQIAQKESFQSIFPPKTYHSTHEERQKWETFLAFKNFALLCALFFDAGAEICESSLHTVTSLDSHHMKENNTEQTTSLKTFKKINMAMKWAQFTQEKQQQTQVHFCVSLIYFYIYAYISTLWNNYFAFILKQSL